jgi:hypothetical protein
MEVSYAMLANYAEENSGLLYLQGGNWDTMTVGQPLPPGLLPPGAPENALGAIRGFYVARLSFHPTEVGQHSFEIEIVDEDGGEVVKVGGQVNVQPNPSLPPTWNLPVNLIVPLTGVLVPKAGLYRISLKVGTTHQNELQFRVIKGY